VYDISCEDERVRAFQRMFAKNIRRRRWMENGGKVENV